MSMLWTVLQQCLYKQWILLGLEKTGIAIGIYLPGAFETIGPSNVLQVVTHNTANYKAVGKKIKKVHKHILVSLLRAYFELDFLNPSK